MSNKKVNLEEIMLGIKFKLPLSQDEKVIVYGNIGSYYSEIDILNAMREACRQVLELASENAEVRITENALIEEGYCNSYYDDGVMTIRTDVQSITNTINQVE